MNLSYSMVCIIETEKEGVDLGPLTQINKIQHNISVVDSAIAIIKQNETRNFYVLISTKKF